MKNRQAVFPVPLTPQASVLSQYREAWDRDVGRADIAEPLSLVLDGRLLPVPSHALPALEPAFPREEDGCWVPAPLAPGVCNL